MMASWLVLIFSVSLIVNVLPFGNGATLSFGVLKLPTPKTPILVFCVGFRLLRYVWTELAAFAP